LEKLLMEACVELAEQHGDWIEGLQDLGAAGLTSSAVESAARAGTGIEIDIAKVPRREQGMSAYDVMLSESQERMLVIPKRALLELLGSENVASRRWIVRQYDHQVLNNTVVKPGGDAAVLRVKGSRGGIAVATDCNGRFLALDPRVGAQIAVAEAARNVVATG